MDSPGCEVAVAGGGPAGATAALTLVRAGYDVALIEGSNYEWPRVGETLPPSARPLLERLGLWEAFATLESTPSFGNQSAWGGQELWANPFIFSPYGRGWHLDRQRFDSLLAGAAVAAGARCVRGLRVTACTSEAGGSWRLTLGASGAESRTMTACAVIDATGRRAVLGRSLGAKMRVYDHLVGVATHYHGRPNDGGYTLVEATANGWWYSAPVPPDGLMVMFMTDADLCRSQRRADPTVWKRGLAQTEYTRARVADQQQSWGPKVFAAGSHRLEKANWRGRWLACGDAAIGADPLSSSGIERALRTGEEAGRAMAHWLEGEVEAAHEYERNLDSEFAKYWSERATYYAIEMRWTTAPFWQRRSITESGGPRAAGRGKGDSFLGTW